MYKNQKEILWELNKVENEINVDFLAFIQYKGKLLNGLVLLMANGMI